MEGGREWEAVLRHARRVLGRFGDPLTRDAREDLAQETSLLAWQWADKLANEERIEAAVRTIARRHRSRWLVAADKRRWLQYVQFGAPDVDANDAGQGNVREPAAPEPERERLHIDGRQVPLAWAQRRLGQVLSSLSSLDRQLLLGFHEGFCCAELATRFGRTEDCIKTRICRARKRVRLVFEQLVRTAGDLEEPESEEER